MALIRKLLYRKPPDGLLEISDRVYVFDSCFGIEDSSEEKNYKTYIQGVANQLLDHFPESSLLVFNFGQSKTISEENNNKKMTIMEYPMHYQGVPILSMDLIYDFLRSTESWLSVSPHNILLMHCERGGWPVLAFMLAAFLIFSKQYSGEQRTLDMLYKQAHQQLLPVLCLLNPIPSQLRYLQYVSRRNVAFHWPPLDTPLTLDCIIVRFFPHSDPCRPLFRIYAQDPLDPHPHPSKLLFSTQTNTKAMRLYKQAETELVKIDINCNVQGDVVLECSSLQSDMEHEDIMFRIMFNTAFIRSNILMLNSNEIDTPWNTKIHFSKEFRAEILFSDMDIRASDTAANLSCFEEKHGPPMEAFAKVQEFFSHVDWLDSRADAALSVIQKISAETGTDILHTSIPQKVIEELNSSMGGKSEALLNKLDGKDERPCKSQPEAVTRKQAQKSPTTSYVASLTVPAKPTISENLVKARPPPPPSPSAPMCPQIDVIGKSGSRTPPPPPPPPVGPSLMNVNGKNDGSLRSTPGPPPPPPPPSCSVSKPQSSVPIPSAPQPPSASGRFGSGAPKTVTAPPLNSLNARGNSLSRSKGSKDAQNKKLKPLYWLKLTRAVQGSLWAESQKSGETTNAPEIDMSELENLFSASMPNSDRGATGGKPKLGAAAPKSEKVQLIDRRRACNCEIMLSQVKVPLQELMVSVLSLENSALDADQVDNLIKFCPTKEEMELLKSYKGERDKLGKCEQFFLELMRVPRVEAKLRVFSFKMQFETQVSDLRKSLSTVNSASDQIRNSVKLKRVMQTILSLGNALNQGTSRGSAVGFRLDSLLKLTETRAQNKKMTLMHYLCKVIAEKLPEVLDFSDDLTSLEPASKIQLKYLAEEMQAINKGLEKIMQELSMSENDGPIAQEFHKNLREFLCFAEAEVRSLALLYSCAGRNVDALIVYFGEDPSHCPFEQVVTTLLNFTTMFNRAHEENGKQLEMEKRKADKDLESKKAAIQRIPTT